MSSKTEAPRVLCTGIIVLDEVFRVAEFPQPDTKVEAKGFFIVNGGCAANAAVAIARLGGRAKLAGPLGGRSRVSTSTLEPASVSTVWRRRCRRFSSTTAATAPS
jgi:sugar/nucleoside kinase (ribokinase family)